VTTTLHDISITATHVTDHSHRTAEQTDIRTNPLPGWHRLAGPVMVLGNTPGVPVTPAVEVTRPASQPVSCGVAPKEVEVFPAVNVRGASVGGKLVIWDPGRAVAVPVRAIDVSFARQDACRVEIAVYSILWAEHWLV